MMMALAVGVSLAGCGGGVDGDALAAEVQSAVRDSYGKLPNVQKFDGRDAPRITVVTNLADKPENRQEAMGICRTVASVGITVPDFTGVYVTAGEGGALLAECDAVR